MEFRETLLAAQKNQQQKSSESSYYKARFDPPKKEQRQKDRLSANIQKFLAKKDEEEKQKKLEAQRKRDELLAMRDPKALRKIQKTLKVIKSANKSVLQDAVDHEHTAVTRAGPEQPDQDDYGYESQEAAAYYQKLMQTYSKIPEEPKFPTATKTVKRDIMGTIERVKHALQHEDDPVPHKRKRRTHQGDREVSPPSKYEPEKKSDAKDEKPERPKFRKPAPPPMDFNQLLQLAEQKKSEPIQVALKKTKPEAASSSESERPMTKKQKREYEEEIARRQRQKERLEAEKSGKKIQKDDRPVDREQKPQTVTFGRIPKIGDKANSRNDNLKPHDRDRERERYRNDREREKERNDKDREKERNDKDREKERNDRDREKERSIRDREKENDRDREKERSDRKRDDRERDRDDGVRERYRRERDNVDKNRLEKERGKETELEKLKREKERVDREKARIESEKLERLRAESERIEREMERLRKSKDMLDKTKSKLEGKSDKNKLPLDRQKLSARNDIKKSIDLKTQNTYSIDKNYNDKKLPIVGKSDGRVVNGHGSQVTGKPLPKHLPPKEKELMAKKLNGSLKTNGQVKPEIGKNIPDKAVVGKKPDDRRLPQSGPSKGKMSNSFDFDKHVSSLKSKSKQFSPSDVKRKQQGAKAKRRLDSDSEYDSEMDDFIDDGDDDGDYSRHIKEIFGYDKSRYRDIDDEDDPNMESNFVQVQREEFISKKVGLMEDLEDMRLEKMMKAKKGKKKSRISDDDD